MIAPDWDAFRGVVRVLADLGIAYMVVGSVAASFHGLTRATHGVDLVVALERDDIPGLVAALKDGYYVDEEGAFEAAEHADMFNAIHNEGAFKIDFWVLKPDDFSRAQFDRREPVDVDGTRIYVASAEDTVLSKLSWNKISPSDRQMSDVRGILVARKGDLDYNYICTWADRLGVADVLNMLLEER